jgi:hypothetical protein
MIVGKHSIDADPKRSFLKTAQTPTVDSRTSSHPPNNKIVALYIFGIDHDGQRRCKA